MFGFDYACMQSLVKCDKLFQKNQKIWFCHIYCGYGKDENCFALLNKFLKDFKHPSENSSSQFSLGECADVLFNTNIL